MATTRAASWEESSCIRAFSRAAGLADKPIIDDATGALGVTLAPVESMSRSRSR
jgi:hypothetical protein